MSFLFNSKWYRPGFWRNLSQMGPLGKEKNTLSSPRKLSSAKNHFNFKQRCGHLIVNKIALVWKNLEGALHIKQTNNWCLKLIEPRSLKFIQNFRNYETIPIYVEIADEIEANTLFDRSLPSTRCFLDISPERAPLKPVSQRIWTPLRRFGSPYQTFLLSIDFIIFDN